MMQANRAVLVADLSHDDFSKPTGSWRPLFESEVSDLALSPEWTSIAARSAGLAERLRMMTISDPHGRPRSFTSFVETREIQYGLPVLLRELPGNRLVAYHNEIPGDARRELIEGIAAAGGRACDVMHLPAVLRDSPTDVATRELAAARGWRVLRVPGNRSPYVPLVGSWDAFLAGKSSNFRYTLKRKAKALAGHGKVSSVRYERTDTVAELLKHINTIEASSWKAAADMAITGSEQEMAYYNELLPWLASIGALAANVSFIGEQPVAYSLCCHWRGRFAQLKTSFDEKFNAGSPGLVVNAEAIKYAFEAGANEFDFLGDVMPHKQHWTAQLREYDHLFVFTNTLKGRALGAAKQIVQRLRPAQVPITTGRSGRRPDRE